MQGLHARATRVGVLDVAHRRRDCTHCARHGVHARADAAARARGHATRLPRRAIAGRRAAAGLAP
eukprot:14344581-Alexandrium_andersonii.AAC.1